jgi:hypothetical protein
MTIQELIENLQYLQEEHGPDMEVMFSYTASDYWHSQLAQSISSVEVGGVSWSDYHRTNKLNEEGDDVIIIG